MCDTADTTLSSDAALIQALDPRTREMYELYVAGATLEEVGARFSVTRERVRQIFREAGMSIRTMRETIALRNDRLVRQHGEEIRAAFLVSKDIGVVAQQFGLPRVVVREAVKDLLPVVAPPQLRRKLPPIYSTQELLAFLQEAGSAVADVPNAAAYRRYAQGRQTSDGRSWPSPHTIISRFGSWRKALLQAGFKVKPPPRRAAKRRFSEADCLEALRAATQALGAAPTAAVYARFVRSAAKGAFPSEMTIRNRFGSWQKALEKADL
jgi:hypothetical protein